MVGGSFRLSQDRGAWRNRVVQIVSSCSPLGLVRARVPCSDTGGGGGGGDDDDDDHTMVTMTHCIGCDMSCAGCLTGRWGRAVAVLYDMRVCVCALTCVSVSACVLMFCR